MVANSGGSITLRLSLAGEEQVRRGLESLGPAGAKAMRELDRATKEPTGSLKLLGAVTEEGRASLEGFAASGGPAARALGTLGPMGLAAAAGLTAFGLAATVAIAQARKAMEMGDELVATADRVGTTAETLQRVRFVGAEADFAVGQVDAALQQLNATLGAVKSGIGDDKLDEALKALRIDPAQLKSMSDGQQLMLLLADTLGQIEDRTTQLQIARKMGIEEFLPVLRLGSVEITRVGDAAARTGGMFSNEMADGLAQANREMERAQERIDAAMAKAFAPLADDLANIVEGLADMTEWLGRAMNRLGEFEERSKQFAPLRWLSRISGGDGNRNTQGAAEDAVDMLDAAMRESRSSGGGFTPTRVDTKGDAERQRAADAAARAADQAGREAERAAEQRKRDRAEAQRKAEQEAEQRRRRLDAFRGLEARGEDRVGAAFLTRPGSTPDDRASAEFERIANDTRRFAAWLKAEQDKYSRNKGLEGISAAEAEVLESLQSAAAIQERANAEEARRRAVEDDRLATDRQLAHAAAAELGLRLELAATQRERRELGLQQLAIERQAARAALEVELSRSPLSEADKDSRRAGFEAEFEGRRGGVLQSTMTAGQAYLDGLQRSVADSEEALDRLKIEGLQGLEDQLVGLSPKFAEVGGAAGSMADMIIEHLARIGIQRRLIEPLANMMFGPGQAAPAAGGASGGGAVASFVSNLFSRFVAGPSAGAGAGPSLGSYPGRARGGDASGRVWVGEEGRELVDLPPASHVYSTNRTERMIDQLDRATRAPALRTAFAPANDGPPVFNLINRTATPIARPVARRNSSGGLDVELQPLIDQGLVRAGREGTLASAAALSPRAIRRG